ncbi:MAG: hypothetical protein IPM29_03560 [Planctomycetes bacterium]|nr:hypothetical protein [Planctomycetota bacterium]
MRLKPVPAEAGFTLVELLMGVVVFLIAAVVLGNHITTNYNATNSQRDKVFAYAKAQAILSEIHALVDRGDVEAAVDLDILDDGITPRPQLTVTTDSSGNLLTPDHAISGNTWRDGAWVWSRRLSVRPFAGLDNRNVRYVTVRILKRDANGSENELASLSSVVNSVSTAFPATQVFDVYLLAAENVPGWWVFMESIVPFVESAITDLENRNPGLSVRTHWITKLGFGRDSVYRPFVNDELDSYATVNHVYYYPGTMPAGSASTAYYVADIMKGRLLVDTTELNGWDGTTNPYPYALADYYNHCTRWPEASDLNERRVTEATTREEAIRLAQLQGTPVPPRLGDMSKEPTLQVLLEGMISDPDAYRHALLVNLHGELLPVPPLRNYSDAAKCPEALPGLRCVSHPEELRTASPPSSTEQTSVRIRVYAYKTDPDDPTIPDIVPFERSIVLHVLDVNLTDGFGRLAPGVKLESVPGGINIWGNKDYYPPAPAPSYYDVYPTNAMCYAAFFWDPGPGMRKSTRIYLLNTPTTCRVVNDKGLYSNRRSRLYGLEYNPSPMSATAPFGRNLATPGDGPKNTARWILTIPGSVWDEQRFCDTSTPPHFYDPRDVGEDVMLTVHTQFWNLSNYNAALLSGLSPSGTIGLWFEPGNLSRTYSWWAPTRDVVPWTERCQFIGDPRHNPYRDLLHGDPDFGDGYNWFHESLNRLGEDARADFPGLTNCWDRWNVGPNFDVPRFMELFRNAIVRSGAIYTTLSGYSYYYVGCGNEIGYDSSNGYPNSIPVNRKPWGGADTQTGYVNNITGERCLVRDGDVDYWWGMPWLGELCPDDAYLTSWIASDLSGRLRGNLPAGTARDQFFRQSMRTVHDGQPRFRGFGSEMLSAHHRTAEKGCVSFFNNGTSSNHFNHHFSNGNGSLVGPGIELATNYGFPIPSTAYINRPFSLNTSGNVPPEFALDPYASRRFSAALLRQFYNHPSGYTGSGLVQLVDPTGTDAAWLVVNGLGQTTETGSDFLGKYCLLSMYQSFFELGDGSLRYRIEQPPRVEIVSPTEITELRNPTSIDIQIQLEWLRWDRLPYTTSTPANFAEDEEKIDYVVLYSPDNGVSWRNLRDDSIAFVGEKPADPQLLFRDSGVGAEVVRWSVPAARFPEGGYLLRVEAYREDMALHYSVHQVRVFIQR